MRGVVQRVSRSEVRVDGEVVGRIGQGLMVLVGISISDTPQDVIYFAEKISGLRIFDDENGKMNRSVVDIQGAVLLVSQFTLMGDCRKGRRPSFISAARPETAIELYHVLIAELRGRGLTVETGRFQEHMDVELVNDGPITVLIDSHRDF